LTISKKIRKAVIESSLQGLTRAEIAAKYGISTGSVSNIIKEYEEALAIVDLTTIRKDLKLIHKSGFTINECAQASQFLLSMKEFYNTNDIKNLQDFQKYLTNVVESITNLFKSCTQNNIDPAIIPVWIKDFQDFAPNMRRISIKRSKLDSEAGIYPTKTPSLKKLKRNASIPFVSAVSSYIENSKKECEKLQYHNNTLTESVRRLKEEATKLHIRLEQLYQKEEKAMHYLDWYYKLKAELENNPAGAQIDNIEYFVKLMNEFALRGYDANDILSELAHLESAPIKIMIMERELAKLLDKKNTIERNIKFYESRISEYLETILRVDYLEIMGLGYDHLVWLTKIIERISKIENISLKRGANKLLKDIDLQY
jgi:hypothetical protein